MNMVVYAIGQYNCNDKLRYIKFGVTKELSLDLRISTMQTGNPENLRVINYANIGVDTGLAYAIEKLIHQDLIKFRVRGEWYEANKFVYEIATRLGNKKRNNHG